MIRRSRRVCRLSIRAYIRGDGLRSRAACFLHQAENDFDDFKPDLDTLDERTDYVSTAMPVSGCQIWPDRCRELTKAFRRKSQVFQSIDIACVIPFSQRAVGFSFECTGQN